MDSGPKSMPVLIKPDSPPIRFACNGFPSESASQHYWPLTDFFWPCYQRGTPSGVLMRSFPLLLRCFLIVTLCLDGSASLWSASVMAVTQARHAAARTVNATVAVEDCDTDEALAQSGSAAHEDCDCGTGNCGCPCFSSVAAIVHTVPFMAHHTLAAEPIVRSSSHVPLTFRTPVFRPPIG